jgi:hypothetical protein
MDPIRLLALQAFASLIAWTLVARLVVVPWARGRPLHRALAVVMLPLAFRHLGVTMLSEQVVRPTLDATFARHVAIGDGVTVALATISIVLLAGERRFALGTAWLANIVGFADLLFNVANGARIGAADHVGAQWFVLAFGVPGMAVVHGLAFWILISRRADRA